MTMGRTGIEPVALSLKVRCSTPELTTPIRRIIAHICLYNQP